MLLRPRMPAPNCWKGGKTVPPPPLSVSHTVQKSFGGGLGGKEQAGAVGGGSDLCAELCPEKERTRDRVGVPRVVVCLPIPYTTAAAATRRRRRRRRPSPLTHLPYLFLRWWFSPFFFFPPPPPPSFCTLKFTKVYTDFVFGEGKR